MTRQLVYKPCQWCKGSGFVPVGSHMFGSLTMPTCPVVTTCTACQGTGKGEVESIREVTP